MTIGILAYGSLLDDPGRELACTVRRIDDAETPFNVEFARRADTRDGAPTLIPFDDEGARVASSILVLKDSVDEDFARDMLYRRETQKVGTGTTRSKASSGWIHSEIVLPGVDVCLYTAFASNLSPDERSPASLADLAIKSAARPAGMERRDGISYLEAVKHRGVNTPLIGEYEAEILSQTNARNLADAWARARADC